MLAFSAQKRSICAFLRPRLHAAGCGAHVKAPAACGLPLPSACSSGKSCGQTVCSVWALANSICMTLYRLPTQAVCCRLWSSCPGTCCQRPASCLHGCTCGQSCGQACRSCPSHNEPPSTPGCGYAICCQLDQVRPRHISVEVSLTLPLLLAHTRTCRRHKRRAS